MRTRARVYPASLHIDVADLEDLAQREIARGCEAFDGEKPGDACDYVGSACALLALAKAPADDGEWDKAFGCAHDYVAERVYGRI